jgi:hypothetical protein
MFNNRNNDPNRIELSHEISISNFQEYFAGTPPAIKAFYLQKFFPDVFNEIKEYYIDIFSEGLNGGLDDRGKEPNTPPTSLIQAYSTVGGKDDIKARISNDSPGSLTKNIYRAEQREYDNVI